MAADGPDKPLFADASSTPVIWLELRSSSGQARIEQLTSLVLPAAREFVTLSTLGNFWRVVHALHLGMVRDRNDMTVHLFADGASKPEWEAYPDGAVAKVYRSDLSRRAGSPGAGDMDEYWHAACGLMLHAALVASQPQSERASPPEEDSSPVAFEFPWCNIAGISSANDVIKFWIRDTSGNSGRDHWDAKDPDYRLKFERALIDLLLAAHGQRTSAEHGTPTAPEKNTADPFAPSNELCVTLSSTANLIRRAARNTATRSSRLSGGNASGNLRREPSGQLHRRSMGSFDFTLRATDLDAGSASAGAPARAILPRNRSERDVWLGSRPSSLQPTPLQTPLARRGDLASPSRVAGDGSLPAWHSRNSSVIITGEDGSGASGGPGGGTGRLSRGVSISDDRPGVGLPGGFGAVGGSPRRGADSAESNAYDPIDNAAPWSSNPPAKPQSQPATVAAAAATDDGESATNSVRANSPDTVESTDTHPQPPTDTTPSQRSTPRRLHYDARPFIPQGVHAVPPPPYTAYTEENSRNFGPFMTTLPKSNAGPLPPPPPPSYLLPVTRSPAVPTSAADRNRAGPKAPSVGLRVAQPAWASGRRSSPTQAAVKSPPPAASEALSASTSGAAEPVEPPTPAGIPADIWVRAEPFVPAAARGTPPLFAGQPPPAPPTALPPSLTAELLRDSSGPFSRANEDSVRTEAPPPTHGKAPGHGRQRQTTPGAHHHSSDCESPSFGAVNISSSHDGGVDGSLSHPTAGPFGGDLNVSSVDEDSPNEGQQQTTGQTTSTRKRRKRGGRRRNRRSGVAGADEHGERLPDTQPRPSGETVGSQSDFDDSSADDDVEQQMDVASRRALRKRQRKKRLKHAHVAAELGMSLEAYEAMLWAHDAARELPQDVFCFGLPKPRLTREERVLLHKMAIDDAAAAASAAAQSDDAVAHQRAELLKQHDSQLLDMTQELDAMHKRRTRRGRRAGARVRERDAYQGLVSLIARLGVRGRVQLPPLHTPNCDQLPVLRKMVAAGRALAQIARERFGEASTQAKEAELAALAAEAVLQNAVIDNALVAAQRQGASRQRQFAVPGGDWDHEPRLEDPSQHQHPGSGPASAGTRSETPSCESVRFHTPVSVDANGGSLRPRAAASGYTRDSSDSDSELSTADGTEAPQSTSRSSSRSSHSSAARLPHRGAAETFDDGSLANNSIASGASGIPIAGSDAAGSLLFDAGTPSPEDGAQPRLSRQVSASSDIAAMTQEYLVELRRQEEDEASADGGEPDGAGVMLSHAPAIPQQLPQSDEALNSDDDTVQFGSSYQDPNQLSIASVTPPFTPKMPGNAATAPAAPPPHRPLPSALASGTNLRRDHRRSVSFGDPSSPWLGGPAPAAQGPAAQPADRFSALSSTRRSPRVPPTRRTPMADAAPGSATAKRVSPVFTAGAPAPAGGAKDQGGRRRYHQREPSGSLGDLRGVVAAGWYRAAYGDTDEFFEELAPRIDDPKDLSARRSERVTSTTTTNAWRPGVPARADEPAGVENDDAPPATESTRTFEGPP